MMVSFLGTKKELEELFTMIRSPDNSLTNYLAEDRTYVIELTRDGVLEVMQEVQTNTPATSKMGCPRKYANVSRSKKSRQRLAS